MTVKMLNGKYTGKEFKVNNTYTKSGALDQRYYPGNQIFLSQLTKRNGHLTANVAGYKRDVVLVFFGLASDLLAGLNDGAGRQSGDVKCLPQRRLVLLRHSN